MDKNGLFAYVILECLSGLGTVIVWATVSVFSVAAVKHFILENYYACIFSLLLALFISTCVNGLRKWGRQPS